MQFKQTAANNENNAAFGNVVSLPDKFWGLRWFFLKPIAIANSPFVISLAVGKYDEVRRFGYQDATRQVGSTGGDEITFGR